MSRTAQRIGAPTGHSFTPAVQGILQRKCACGSHVSAGGDCARCSDVTQLQRRGAQHGRGAEVPSILGEAARSSGQPLDAATRAFMEPHFGHDFSRVRIHTDAASAESARALEASAFTIGQHIHFGEGEHDPRSTRTLRLLAHELAHTVQQRGVGAAIQRFPADVSATEHVRLEREADRAADAIVSGRAARVVGSARTAAPQREDKTPAQAPKIVAPVEPNKTQSKMIGDARRTAAIRTQTAMFKASGVQGAGPFNDARRLARTKFDWADPNMDQIGEVLSGMGGGLVNVDVKVAGVGDPECGARAGYVRGHRPPIVLCPGFFADPSDNEGRIRTLIHEIAHVKGIGSADVAEQYTPVFDCTSKGAFESADSWANYVHCLSGQTPDKPEEIVVPAPGGKSGQAPKKPDAGRRK